MHHWDPEGIWTNYLICELLNQPIKCHPERNESNIQCWQERNVYIRCHYFPKGSICLHKRTNLEIKYYFLLLVIWHQKKTLGQYLQSINPIFFCLSWSRNQYTTVFITVFTSYHVWKTLSLGLSVSLGLSLVILKHFPECLIWCFPKGPN